MASGSREIKIRFTSDTEGLDQASSDAQSSFKGVSRSTQQASKSMGRAGDTSKKMSGRLDRAGKAGDKVDTTARGMRHGFMGAQDSMLGVSKIAEGDLMPGFIGLGSGISDLGASVYNGIMPALKGLGGRMRTISERAGGVRGSLKKIGKMGGIFAGVIAGLGLLDKALSDDVQPDIDALTLGLERFDKKGDLSGEAARLLGDDLEGVTTAAEEMGEGFGGMITNAASSIPILNKIPANTTGTDLDEASTAVDSLDESLAGVVQSEGPEKASRLLDTIGKKAGLSDEEFGNLKSQLPQYQSAQEKANSATEDGAKAIEEQLEAQKKATDPIYQLRDSLDKVDEAQSDYNDAVDENGPKSQEAKDKAWDLSEAVSGAQQAANNTDKSFGDFNGALDDMQAQGMITQGQAETLRGAVGDLKGQADDYTWGSPYSADVNANDNASDVFASIRSQASSLNSVLNPFGGGLASGGPVSKGTPYLVGEEGPELFTPGASGNITPNDKLGGGGGGGAAVGGGASPEALREALSGMELRVDGRGMANLVNRSNKRQERRRAAN